MQTGLQRHPLSFTDHNRKKYTFAGNLTMTVQLALQHFNNSDAITSMQDIYEEMHFTTK
jgi:hypothetical protein